MTLDSRAIRGIFLTNIFALVAAVVTLIWNAAVLTEQVTTLKEEQARMRAVQTSVVLEQESMKQRILSHDQAQILLDGRIFRLEDLSLQAR